MNEGENTFWNTLFPSLVGAECGERRGGRRTIVSNHSPASLWGLLCKVLENVVSSSTSADPNVSTVSSSTEADDQLENVAASSIFADPNASAVSSSTEAELSFSREADDDMVNNGAVSSSTVAVPVSSKMVADPKLLERGETRVLPDAASSPSDAVVSSMYEKSTTDSCTIEFIKSAPYAVGCAVTVG